MDLWVWVATWDQAGQWVDIWDPVDPWDQEDLWGPMVQWEWGQTGRWEDIWDQMDLWVVRWAQMDQWEDQWGQMVPIMGQMDLDMVLMVPCLWVQWVDLMETHQWAWAVPGKWVHPSQDQNARQWATIPWVPVDRAACLVDQVALHPIPDPAEVHPKAVSTKVLP